MIGAWPSPAGGEEYAAVFDRGRAHRLLVLPALFDEGNKLRHFTVEVMRRLDGAGIDAFLPDLPGCNESMAPLEAQTLTGWRSAVEAAAGHFRASHVLTVRGGALCAPGGLPAWRYAPLTGVALLRGLLRARILASKEAGREEDREALTELGRREGLELAGYRLGATMLRELEAAEPAGAALANIQQATLGGAGLWLRAEPAHDPQQADALAAIVAMGFLGMTRRHLTFTCEGAVLAGTLDDSSGTAGLLWVGGGNEIRSGAFSGQAQLAAQIAAAGYPVFRFDRRGVGDSEGVNFGFGDSGPDIAAALAAFRAERPGLARVVAFGNCDAASALMLNAGAGADALVLANPWTIESADGDEDAAPPPAAIRARYAAKLKDPREWLRAARGGVSFGKLAKGLARAAAPAPAPSSLAQQMRAGLTRFGGPARILLAERDRTAQVFLTGWDGADPRLARCPGGSHAFVEPDARAWLLRELLAALADE